MTSSYDLLMMVVSRIEIAECIEGLFDGSAVRRSQLVASAEESGARHEVVHVLERLGDQDYWDLRDLWPQLADVPVER